MLTEKRAAFIREYLIDMNGTQAAVRAGYSPKTANEQAARLLANASVRAAVDDAIAKRAAEAGVDALWVLTEAQSVYRAAREAERLGEALKALELVGKHVDVQAFKDRVEHSGGVAIIVSSEDAGL